MTLDGHDPHKLPAGQQAPRLFFGGVPVFALLACAIGGTGLIILNQLPPGGVKREAHDPLGAIADLRVRSGRMARVHVELKTHSGGKDTKKSQIRDAHIADEIIRCYALN